MMNVHHLELFYYVAKYEGIVAACRHMPYGIQQPAMSAQVAKLESDLGVTLFERRPFRLTEAGRTLYEFVAPFFGRLDEVEAVLRGNENLSFRLAGLTEVMRDHVPALLGSLQKEFPDLKVTLQEIDQRGAERLISEGEADLAVTVLESRLPSGFHSSVLARLPMGLLVSAESEFRDASEVLEQCKERRLPLISLPGHELLPRLFQKGLALRKVTWETAMETSSQNLVAIYVRNGLGVGLSVLTPDLASDRTVRFLPLEGFDPLPVGAFWRGKLSMIASRLLEALQERSKAFGAAAPDGWFGDFSDW